MPVIRLSDATFAELKAISTWLSTSTPSETIDRLVREKLDALGLESDTDDEPDAASPDEIVQFEQAPGLTFTRLISAKIGGGPIKKANWAGLLVAMIAAVKAKGLSGEKLVSELQVPAKTRSFSDDGFQIFPRSRHFRPRTVCARCLERSRAPRQQVENPCRSAIPVATKRQGSASRPFRAAAGRKEVIRVASKDRPDFSGRSLNWSKVPVTVHFIDPCAPAVSASKTVSNQFNGRSPQPPPQSIAL